MDNVEKLSTLMMKNLRADISFTEEEKNREMQKTKNKEFNQNCKTVEMQSLDGTSLESIDHQTMHCVFCQDNYDNKVQSKMNARAR